MAKIIKVGSQNITPNKIANPFRTSRNSTTNPFKYNNFEGNTLPFELAADVFKSSTQKTNKLRMIASSVTGSMTRMKSSITEPIVNFVKRVGGGISSAWTYAKETPISQVPGIRHMNEAVGSMNAKIVNKLSSMHEEMSSRVSSRMEAVSTSITEFGNDMRTQWNALIAKLPSRQHYTADTPVSELENAWKEIIALEGGIA
ncbi:MAG: hypothetical protein E7Z92_04220 [Cyanobacteria bacterium SIG31]|nr:hypothetical protein [Cyanobacteria bacterium SIG31]